MIGFKNVKVACAILVTTVTMVACSGGAPPSQNITPVRVAKAEPTRDANGNALTTRRTIPEGIEFTAQTLDFVSSESAVEGEPIHLEVDNSVVVDGAVVIGSGAPVRGVISAVNHAGRMGKAGSVSIRIESAETVDGQRIPVRASKTAKTDDKTGNVVALTLLVSPLFLLKKGNDVAYQPGTRVTIYTDQKLNVSAWKK